MMAVQQRAVEPFDIHEDLRTEDTVMMVDEEQEAHNNGNANRATAEPEQGQEEVDDDQQTQQAEEEENGEEDDGETSEDEPIDRGVQADMDKLQDDFPGFADKYRLIKRIGEGSRYFISWPRGRPR